MALQLGEGLQTPPFEHDAPTMTGSHFRVAQGGELGPMAEKEYDLVYCFASGHGDFLAAGAEAYWPFPVNHSRIVFLAAGVTHRLVNRGLGELCGYVFAVPQKADSPDADKRPHKMTYGVYEGKREMESGRCVWQPVFKPNPASRISAIELAELAEGGASVRHRSRSTEEIFYFVRGTGTVVLDGVTYYIEPGSAVMVPKNVEHEVHNTGEGLMLHFTVLQHLAGTDAE